MVAVPQQTAGSGGSLAHGPLHDGVSAVGEGWAVLPDGAVDEPKVLKYFQSENVTEIFLVSYYH